MDDYEFDDFYEDDEDFDEELYALALMFAPKDDELWQGDDDPLLRALAR